MGRTAYDRVQIAASWCLRHGEPFIPAVEFCTPCWTAFLLVPRLCLPVRSDARAELKLEQILGRLQLPEPCHPGGIVFSSCLQNSEPKRMERAALSTPFPGQIQRETMPSPFSGECECCRLLQAAFLPGQHPCPSSTRRLLQPWHVAVLASPPAWDVPQVCGPQEWLFLGKTAEEQAQPLPLAALASEGWRALGSPACRK